MPGQPLDSPLQSRAQPSAQLARPDALEGVPTVLMVPALHPTAALPCTLGPACHLLDPPSVRPGGSLLCACIMFPPLG